MAMRTEQHDNLFAKLNNGNLSDDAVRDDRSRTARAGAAAGMERPPSS
jgi:hypothetical protein